MGIDISPQHEDFVRCELESGRYNSEQELVNEAIDLLRQRQGVLAKLQIGVEQLRSGECTQYGPADRARFLADILGRPMESEDQES